jgi:hypothetical protein
MSGEALVAVDELPERQRAVLEAYGTGGETWDRMRETVLADPELLRFTVDNLTIEMVRAHDGLTALDPARARRAHDRARAELIRLAPASTRVLVELFVVSDAVVARLVGETLVEIGDGVAPLVAPMLDGEQPKDRRRAAVLLRLLPHAGRREDTIAPRLAALVRSDPDWFVRAESARTLGTRAGKGRDTRAARAVLERALSDPDPAVAEYAALGLGALDDPRAVPSLVRALERAAGEGEGKLLQAAQGALRELTGVPRELDVPGWMAWWRKHGVEAAGGPH